MYGYQCGDCDHLYGHKKEGPEYTKEDATQWESAEAVCPLCNFTDYPVPLFRCLHKKGYGKQSHWEAGCADPVYEHPWLYTYVIRTTKSGRSNAYGVEHFELVEDDALPELTGIPDALRDLDMAALVGRMPLKDQMFALNLDTEPFDLADAQQVLDRYFAAGPDEEDADSLPVDPASNDIDTSDIPF